MNISDKFLAFMIAFLVIAKAGAMFLPQGSKLQVFFAWCSAFHLNGQSAASTDGKDTTK